jgi:hypothetical protein
MTALDAARNPEILQTPRLWRTFGCEDEKVIYPGALVVLNTDGYLEPATTSTSITAVGFATPKAQQMRDGVVDTTGTDAGDMECEVDSGIGLLKSSADADEITANDIGKDCYIVDDQTVALTAGGTLQVTEATLTFNGTDEVGLFIDGVLVAVPCNTNAATTIDNWLVEFAKYDQLGAIVTATDGTTKIVLTFKTPGKHSVEDHSPATASFAVSHTTAGVAATRSRAGKVWNVEARGVRVAVGMP